MTAGVWKNRGKAGLVLSLLLLLQACRSEEPHPQPAPEQHSEQQPPEWSDQQLKKDVVGIWEEVNGTQETLQFNPDGTLIMKSPSEHRFCDYSFPNSGHIRLDCAWYEGGPRAAQTWRFAMTADEIMISDRTGTGTYRRK